MHSPIFSLEVFPPKRTSPVGTIYDTLDGLQGLDPDFISVTYGTGKSSDRTLTARIAHTVNEYGIPAVAHLTAQYLDKDDVDEALDLFDQAKVSGVLALRGDRVEGAEPAGVFDHASDLAAYIREKRPNLKIYGACYPEKHYEAPSMEEDLHWLKHKVEQGADALISQLFFDNDAFYRFMDAADQKGITVPIHAGIMPITSAKMINTTINLSGASIPKALSDLIATYGENPSDMRKAGIEYAARQINDLAEQGMHYVHIYTMNHSETAKEICGLIK